jgi:inner membrane protein
VIWTARTHNPKFVRAALLLTTLYIVGFGAWQHHRAMEAQQQLAALRGHNVEHVRVMPAPGWLLLWRSTYIADGRLYADGIRTPWLGATAVLEGGSADAVTLENLPAAAKANAETRRRFEILNWFADRLIAPIDNDANAIGDMRITSGVESLTPLWGLQFDPRSGAAAAWHPTAPLGRDYQQLLQSLLFSDDRYKPISSISRIKITR